MYYTIGFYNVRRALKKHIYINKVIILVKNCYTQIVIYIAKIRCLGCVHVKKAH